MVRVHRLVRKALAVYFRAEGPTWQSVSLIDRVARRADIRMPPISESEL